MEELNGYAPPVSLNLNDFQYTIGDAVAKAIAKAGIQVNQEELLKALKEAEERRIAERRKEKPKDEKN